MFKHVLSLGATCQTGFQARRLGASQSASYFDWLITPSRGVAQVISTRFSDAFKKEDLVISDDKNEVFNRKTGFRYLHHFSKDKSCISMADIDHNYEEQYKKFEHMAQKFQDVAKDQPILFIRQTGEDASLIMDLIQSLSRFCDPKHFGLLVVRAPGEVDFVMDHPNACVTSVAEAPPGPDSWMGDNDQWDRAYELAKERFRHLS